MYIILMPMLPWVGAPELLILLILILLLFGARRIPELAKGLGSGVREFRKGTRGEEEEKGEKLTADVGEDGGEARGVHGEAPGRGARAL